MRPVAKQLLSWTMPDGGRLSFEPRGSSANMGSGSSFRVQVQAHPEWTTHTLPVEITDLEYVSLVNREPARATLSRLPASVTRFFWPTARITGVVEAQPGEMVLDFVTTSAMEDRSPK